MKPPPTIGRVVHYRAAAECGGEIYAGMIVRVHEAPGVVDLVTFGSTSIYHNNGVPFAAESTPGAWSWPPITAPRPAPAPAVVPD